MCRCAKEHEFRCVLYVFDNREKQAIYTDSFRPFRTTCISGSEAALWPAQQSNAGRKGGTISHTVDFLDPAFEAEVDAPRRLL